MKPVDPAFHLLFELKPRKSDLKKMAIIQAAVASLAKDGFEGGTFDKVAKRLKTRRSHIVYYFKDRDELFMAVIKYVIATAQQITVEMVSAQTDPFEQVMAMGDAAFEWSEQHPEQAKVLTFFYFICGSDAKFRKLNSQIREAGEARLQALLGAAFKGKVAKVNLEELAKGLQSVMTGLVLDSVTTEKPKGLGYRELAKKICQSWLEKAV